MELEIRYNFDAEEIEKVRIVLLENHSNQSIDITRKVDHHCDDTVLVNFLKYAKEVNGICGVKYITINENGLHLECVEPNWNNFGYGCEVYTKLVNSATWDLDFEDYDDYAELHGLEDKFGKINKFMHYYLPSFHENYIKTYGLENLYKCYFLD